MLSEIFAECLDCGHRFNYSPTILICPNCSGQWLEARYDYESLSHTLPSLATRRPFNLWRYRDVLPVKEFNQELFMGEGGTPLIHAANVNSNIYFS